MSPNRRLQGPDPSTRFGALFYAVLASLIAAVVLAVMHHVHVHVDWT